MNDTFGDADPEDAYDASDPPAVRLRVIERIVDDLIERGADDRREPRRLDALRLLDNLEAVPGVDLMRARDLRDELEEL